MWKCGKMSHIFAELEMRIPLSNKIVFITYLLIRMPKSNSQQTKESKSHFFFSSCPQFLLFAHAQLLFCVYVCIAYGLFISLAACLNFISLFEEKWEIKLIIHFHRNRLFLAKSKISIHGLQYIYISFPSAFLQLLLILL